MKRLRDRLILVLAGMFLAVGAFGWLMSVRVAADPTSENLALTDKQLTAEVQTAVSKALNGVLSYDYANPAASSQVADRALAGQARREYNRLVVALHEKAPDQQLVLTAQVQAAAVKELSADAATLLVFLDQSSQRVDDKQASISAAQLAIQAHRIKGVWTITELRTL